MLDVNGVHNPRYAWSVLRQRLGRLLHIARNDLTGQIHHVM
jgi:hypothetical protein